MKQEDFTAFARLLTAVADTVGRSRPGHEAIAMTFDALCSYDYERVKKAYMAHIAGPEGRFWPTPSHIVELLRGTPQDRSALAWALVEKMLASNAGTRESVRFPAPEYHWAIQQMGGWIELGAKYEESDRKEAAFLSREFREYYSIAEKAHPAWKEVPDYLSGEWEATGAATPTAKKVRIVGTGELVPREKIIALTEGKDKERAAEQLAASIQALAGGKE